MIDYPNLIPECNVDTAFVEMLGYKNPNHAESITQVSSILEKAKPKQKAIGFIDNDKKKTSYISQFETVDTIKNVSLFKHPDREHYLVIVDPAMDEFIYNLCKNLAIDPGKYNIPSELRSFISFTKKTSTKNNPHFRNLLNTIKQKDPKEIAKIRSWVEQYSPYKIR
jgi:hypothetical protein